MISINRLTILLFCVFFICTNELSAQNAKLNQLLSLPHIDKVIGAAHAERIVFTVNEKGHRNVYLAEAPDYSVQKVTSFDEDSAQEITSLSISDDGNWAIFARGGDHGANSAPVATNSGSLIQKTNIDIYSVYLESKKVYKIGLGDFPIFGASDNSVTYFRSGQVWTSSLDKENAGKQLFTMRGTAGNIQWSPDGSKLAFVSRRGTHSFIGIYEKNSQRIQWISPSFNTDHNPNWSPDGKKVAFVRRNAIGGPLDSITAAKFQPWSIIVADIDHDLSYEVYKAPYKIQASFPRIAGQINLKWKHNDFITFMSYEDGWPHLYKLSLKTRKVSQLTKGNFTVDDISYDASGKRIVFSANTGTDPYDFERSHIGIVHIDNGKVHMLSQGESIETKPSFFGNDSYIVWKTSKHDEIVQPEIYNVKDKSTFKVEYALMPLHEFDFIKPTQVWITAEDGIKFSAQLFKGKNANSKSPALVYIHGGPRRQMYLGWHHIDYYFYDYSFNQYLASLGFTVLSVNYRMGTGYGYDFQHPINSGSLGASEYLDIKAAGEWLQKQTFVDPNKVGLFGGSYGGYLTAFGLAKNSDIFKAGVDIHGVHNRERKQNPEYYAPDFELATKINWESSPSKWVDTWTSPVLIIHGDDDQNVDFAQSIDLYKRLKNKGVEVEALVLPDENHHWQLFENLIKVKDSTANYLLRKLK